MSLLLQVALCGLGGWRLASLLVREDGPGDIFGRLRDRVGVPRGVGEVEGFAASLLSCIWCASIWSTSLLWLLWYLSPEVAAVPAAWAVAMATAIVLDRLTP